MATHYIFDFDGVISNSFQIAVEEINRLVSTRFHGLPCVKTQEDAATLYCGPLRTSLRRFGLTDKESKQFFDAHSAAMVARSQEIMPFDAVLAVIQERAFGKCSIVTSSYSEAVHTILAKSSHFAKGMFYAVKGRELAQPKTQKIADILTGLSVAANEVIHFGDMVSDLLYSREIGVPFCAVGWGYHPIAYLQSFDPMFAVENPSALCEFLS